MTMKAVARTMDATRYWLMTPVLIATLALALLLSPWHVASAANDAQVCGQGDEYSVRRLDSQQVDELCETYRGKVMLIVNTASRCAFTDQYEDLEALYQRYREHGLVVVGFPSNDFAAQEPGGEREIREFCRLTYGVEFPMYAKTRVRGEQAASLYRALARASGSEPGWNFHKYLVDREGWVVASFNSMVNPGNGKISAAIEALL